MSNFVSGDWNLVCDVCAKKIKASEAKRRWDGLIVCPQDYEFRHPQDFLQAKQDKIAVPFSRPQPDQDVFLDVTYVSDYVVANYTVDDPSYFGIADL